MRPDGVVFFQPIFRDGLGFSYRLEKASIQDILPVSPIEALDVSILGWFSGLNEGPFNLMFCCPVGQLLGDELGAVVDTQLFGQSAPEGQHIQDADDPHSWYGGVDFNPQSFSVEIIENVQGSDGTAAGQAVMHEIQ